MGVRGDYFHSFLPLVFFLQRKHLFGVGMILIKIIKEKVRRKKVNEAIHTSSRRDAGVRQRKITVPQHKRGDSHESAGMLLSGLLAATAGGSALSSRWGWAWFAEFS